MALTLLEQPDGIVPSLVEKLGHDPAAPAGEARMLVDRLPRLGSPIQPAMSSTLSKVVSKSVEEAKRLHDEFVSTEHLFIAMVLSGSSTDIGRRPPLPWIPAPYRGTGHAFDRGNHHGLAKAA